jgi:DNA-binding NarL/FixJ family response regulator
VVAERLSRFRSLLESGADRVLLRGYSAAELAEAVRQLADNGPGAAGAN